MNWTSGVLAASLVVSGYFWLQEHDRVVALKAVVQQQADSLDKASTTTDALRKAVVALDSAYAADTWKYKKQLHSLENKKDSLEHSIDSLLNDIARALPTDAQYLTTRVGNLCKAQADQVYSALIVCESLRKQAVDQIAKRDTLNVRLMGERDGYRKLYQTMLDQPKPHLGWVERGVWTLIGATLRSLF